MDRMEARSAAVVEAFKTIQLASPKPSQPAALAIVQDVFARAGFEIADGAAASIAEAALSPRWPFLHPVRAWRAGYRPSLARRQAQ